MNGMHFSAVLKRTQARLVAKHGTHPTEYRDTEGYIGHAYPMSPRARHEFANAKRKGFAFVRENRQEEGNSSARVLLLCVKIARKRNY